MALLCRMLHLDFRVNSTYIPARSRGPSHFTKFLVPPYKRLIFPYLLSKPFFKQGVRLKFIITLFHTTKFRRSRTKIRHGKAIDSRKVAERSSRCQHVRKLFFSLRYATEIRLNNYSMWKRVNQFQVKKAIALSIQRRESYLTSSKTATNNTTTTFID